jgi:hypothetical protein
MAKPFLIEVQGDEVVVLVWTPVYETAPAKQAPVVIETTGEAVS